MQALEDLADRLAFVRPPFDLANVARIGRRLRRRLDRARLYPAGRHAGRARRPPRGGRCQTMDYLRQFADAGVAIIVVAALARSKDAKGRSSYTDGLSLASFRETSELEYGADDAFILAPADDAKSDGAPSSRVVLKHLKSRHGETRDIALTFDRKHQRFTPAEPAEPAARADRGKLQAALRALWEKTQPAQDDGEAEVSATDSDDRQAENVEASVSASLRDV